MQVEISHDRLDLIMTQGAQSMALLMFLSTIPIFGVAVYVFRNRSKPGGRGLALCLFGMIGWSLMLLFVTWPSPVLPVHLNVTGRFAFQALVAVGWPLFVWEYLRRDHIHLSKQLVAGVLVIPTISVLLAVTNPFHYLVINATTPANPMGISEFVLQPWYYVHISYASVLALLPIGLLISDFRGSHGIHRQQLLLLIGGWVVGFPGALQTHLFRNIEFIPLYIDFTPTTFLVTALLWGLALDRYQLFNIIPVSRRTAVETLVDPVITIGQSEVVVDINRAAKDVFDAEKYPIGTSVEQLCQAYPELRSVIDNPSASTELTVSAGGETREFLPQTQPVTRGKQEVGTVIVFRDVTRLREREADLELLNGIFARVFRHNIRNQLNIIEGYATLIKRHDTANTYTSEIDEIQKANQQLLAHSEKATELRDLIRDDQQRQEHNISNIVRTRAQRIEDETPATVDISIKDGITILGHPLVTTAITELFENAITHHTGGSPPHLAVTVQAEGESGVIHIEDDGPGIDADEIATLIDREETALSHGSGVGLWLIEHVVRKSNGSFSITDSDTLGGTRATIRFSQSTART